MKSQWNVSLVANVAKGIAEIIYSVIAKQRLIWMKMANVKLTEGV